MVDGLKDTVRTAIIETLSANDRVNRVVLFGSRAMETFTNSSDVDIAIFGNHLTLSDQARFADELDSLPVPQRVDVLIHDRIKNDDLIRHIEEHGVEWWNRTKTEKSEWREMELGEFAAFNYGKGLRQKDRNELGSVPVYGSNGVVGYHDEPWTKGPAVIIGRKGTVGAVHFSPEVCWPIDTTFYVTDEDAEVIKFKYYLLKSLGLDHMNTDTAVPGLNRNNAHALKVIVPPLPEQRRIAHILGTLDDKIELNRRMNETLEEMARAIFKDWFVDFGPVRAKMEGREAYLPDEIWRLFPDRLVESELGEVPEGWGVKALDEIANYRNGLALQKFRPEPGEERLPVVKIAQLRSGIADSEEWATAGITPECVIDDGDVVFSWSGSLLVKVWTGGRAALNQHLFKVTSDTYPKWFYLYFTKHHLAEFQSIAADKTTTMGHIKRQHLKEAKCAVPSPEILEAASDRLESLLQQSILNDVASRRLTALRDGLLPGLVMGEVGV